MADRVLIDDPDSMVGDFPQISTQDGKLTGVLATALTQSIRAIIHKVNGLISLGSGQTGHRAGNLDAQYVDVLTPSVADTEFPIIHGLKRVAVGYEVVRRDKSAVVYDSSFGSWNENTMYLKCNTASTSLKIRVY